MPSNPRAKPLFGHRLQRLRKKLRLTQKEMATMLCCSLHSLENWEGKEYEPDHHHAAVMLEMLFALVKTHKHLDITRRLQATEHSPVERFRLLFKMERESQEKVERAWPALKSAPTIVREGVGGQTFQVAIAEIFPKIANCYIIPARWIRQPDGGVAFLWGRTSMRGHELPTALSSSSGQSTIDHAKVISALAWDTMTLHGPPGTECWKVELYGRADETNFGQVIKCSTAMPESGS